MEDAWMLADPPSECITKKEKKSKRGYHVQDVTHDPTQAGLCQPSYWLHVKTETSAGLPW